MEDPLAFFVVEDDALVRRVVLKTLSRHGHVDGVGSCEEARRSLPARRYDSLIIDVNLPDGSGLDLVPSARSTWPGILILVVTGSFEHAHVARAHELGLRFLLKPFTTQQLEAHVAETRARRNAGERRIAVALERWTQRYSLTEVEAELLTLGVRGVARDGFAKERGVRPDTVRKQIQSLLRKTGDDTFEGAVSSVLREAASVPD